MSVNGRILNKDIVAHRASCHQLKRERGLHGVPKSVDAFARDCWQRSVFEEPFLTTSTRTIPQTTLECEQIRVVEENESLLVSESDLRINNDSLALDRRVAKVRGITLYSAR